MMLPHCTSISLHGLSPKENLQSERGQDIKAAVSFTTRPEILNSLLINRHEASEAVYTWLLVGRTGVLKGVRAS